MKENPANYFYKKYQSKKKNKEFKLGEPIYDETYSGIGYEFACDDVINPYLDEMSYDDAEYKIDATNSMLELEDKLENYSDEAISCHGTFEDKSEVVLTIEDDIKIRYIENNEVVELNSHAIKAVENRLPASGDWLILLGILDENEEDFILMSFNTEVEAVGEIGFMGVGIVPGQDYFDYLEQVNYEGGYLMLSDVNWSGSKYYFDKKIQEMSCLYDYEKLWNL